jgi:hypothetical protein
MRSETSGNSLMTRRANRPDNTALTVGTSPRMTRPDGLPFADLRSSLTCSIWRIRPVVRSSSIRPALVRSMPRPLRTNSSTRSSCSSSLMCRLSAGWAARSRSAALLRLPSSATARKVRNCLRSIGCPGAYLVGIIRRFRDVGAISSMFDDMRVNGSARRDASLVMLLLVANEPFKKKNSNHDLTLRYTLANPHHAPAAR